MTVAGFYLFDKERFDYAINEFRCGRGELALIGEAQLAEGDPDAVLRTLGGKHVSDHLDADLNVIYERWTIRKVGRGGSSSTPPESAPIDDAPIHVHGLSCYGDHWPEES